MMIMFLFFTFVEFTMYISVKAQVKLFVQLKLVEQQQQ